MDQIVELAKRCGAVDLFGSAGDPPPSDEVLAGRMQQGALVLPLPYRDAYATPICTNLPRLQQLATAGRIHTTSVEALGGALFQHTPGFSQAAPLRRFLAVVCDLYDSFLNAEKRAGLMLPMDEVLPPLATFQHTGDRGPFTIEVDLVRKFAGGATGLVSLPATFADHPLLWASLCHETGGHDVIHADEGLLSELQALIGPTLAGLPMPAGVSAEQMAALWHYWMDEAAADIYGVLNVGPAFGPSTAALLAGFNKSSGGELMLRLESGFSPDDARHALDPHPMDALRQHLALGAIDKFAGLAPSVRNDYVARIEAMTRALTPEGDAHISGVVNGPAGQMALEFAAPVETLRTIARAVGAAIATAAPGALHGHSIQDIETWDDADEARVQAMLTALGKKQSIVGMGDDAQLLAGATLAALAAPGDYDAITKALNDALDHSFANDPLWGLPAPDHMYMRYR
jgi:hypothetical protein